MLKKNRAHATKTSMLPRMRAGRTTAMVVFFVLLSVSTAVGSVSATRYTWRATIIDSTGNVGRYSSLAIASNGTIYILYLNDDGRILRLATVVGGSPSFEVVAGPGAFVGDTSLALDARGDLHISYYDGNSTYVRYGHRAASGGPWNFTSVDIGYFEGYNRLALDTLGAPRIAYTTLSDTLRYAYLSGSTWIREDVDPSTPGAKFESLAIDRSGNPHIAYYGSGQLRHASKPNLAWVIDIADARDYFGEFASIGISGEGEPSAAYYDSTNGSLWYAEETSTGWSRSVVDATGNPGQGISLVIGSDDQPRIAYYAQYLGELRYAMRVNGTWEIQIADEDYTVGWEPSLALDGNGTPHIAYYDFTRGALRHAVGLSVLGTRTAGASDVTQSGSLLRGEVTSLGHYVSANASFNWRRVGDTQWQNTTPSSTTNTGPFEARLSNLSRGTRYEFRAIVEAGGRTETGRIWTFTTPAPVPQDPLLFLFAAVAIAVAAVGLSLTMLVWLRPLLFRRRGGRRRDGSV